MHVLSKSKKKALLEALEELNERMPSLLDVDHPCAQREIATAHQLVEVSDVNKNCGSKILERFDSMSNLLLAGFIYWTADNPRTRGQSSRRKETLNRFNILS